jgi:AP-4 complex subunit epsilon-1
MYEVLGEALRRGDNGSNSGYGMLLLISFKVCRPANACTAIVYECVRTICSIFPHKPLLDAAAESISQFIASHNNNLKYLGLTLLAQIVQINPLYAIQHQIHVINCLEDPDESIQRKTLTLLYRMTNPKNVTVVAEKLVDYLKKSNDAFLRAELVSKITMLAEKCA